MPSVQGIRDLVDEITQRHPRIELVGLAVDQKQGTALSVQRIRNDLDESREHDVEGKGVCQLVLNVQERRDAAQQVADLRQKHIAIGLGQDRQDLVEIVLLEAMLEQTVDDIDVGG